MTPPHDAILKAHASKLGWMTPTFVRTKKLSGAWERAWSQALDWCDDIKQRMDKCDHSLSHKPHSWQRSLFFLRHND